MVSNAPLRDTVRRVVPSGWSAHPNLWIVACDYATGRRVAFGRSDAPEADLADAVAASCAIPGYYQPVVIDGRTYVDGGVHSPTNGDLLRERNLDLIVVSSPMTVAMGRLSFSPAAQARALIGAQLRREVHELRRTGAVVVTFEPVEADIQAMGVNPMDARRRAPVARQARESALRRLEQDDLAAVVALLGR
jgi:NTE family protein